MGHGLHGHQPSLPARPLQEKNARLLGAAQQLFGHCQAQKEEIKRLFQQKLDEVEACAPAPAPRPGNDPSVGWGAGRGAVGVAEIQKARFLVGRSWF